MKKVISILISVIMLLNTTLAYTLTLTIAGVEMTTTWEEGDEVTIESKMEKIVGWKVKSGDIELVNNKFTMPNEDVEIEALMKYQLTVENMYVTTKEEKTQDQSVTITATSNEDNVFATWTAEGITLSATEIVSPTITFNMPGNDVTLTANYLTLGSYIEYIPSKTTATVYGTDSGARVEDMTAYGMSTDEYEAMSEENVDSEGKFLANRKLIPSQVTSWRILKNNNGQLDIISTESIGDLILRGETGYVKAVYTLNKLCEDYINPTYADSARNPGYVEGSSCEIIDTIRYPLTYDDTQGLNGFPYQDTLYAADCTQIKDTAKVLCRGISTWLASRTFESDSESSRFNVLSMFGDGNLNDFEALYFTYPSGTQVSNCSRGSVRPVISLKSGIKITGGNGTEEFPFTIAID